MAGYSSPTRASVIVRLRANEPTGTISPYPSVVSAAMLK